MDREVDCDSPKQPYDVSRGSEFGFRELLFLAKLATYGAFNNSMAHPALAACAVFMLGLAGGRILSFMLDGLPHWLLMIYAILEVLLGTIAVALYKLNTPTSLS